MVAGKSTALAAGAHSCRAGQPGRRDGFRTIEGCDAQIPLNGSPIFLRGVYIHAEAPYCTRRACNDLDMKTLLKYFQGWAQGSDRAWSAIQ